MILLVSNRANELMDIKPDIAIQVLQFQSHSACRFSSHCYYWLTSTYRFIEFSAAIPDMLWLYIVVPYDTIDFLPSTHQDTK